MTLNEWVAASAAFHPDRDNALMETRYLATHITGISPTQQRIHNPVLSATQEESLNSLAQRLHRGEPLAYLLGSQPFYGLELQVNHHTLIPRNDSESVVDRALTLIQDCHAPVIIDLGTGSGALALAIAAARPDAIVSASDQSDEALSIAATNARAYQLENITFLQANWLQAYQDCYADLIISNPPYIAADDPHLDALQYEPKSALIADDNGYRDLLTIMEQAPRVLKPQGWLLMEHGWQQAETLRMQAIANPIWQQIASHPDYAGRDRMTEMQKRGQ
ncbi:MAG: peptide chain release factor N(5)-glutamine methyltransferase [Cardiobacteriaceae bacterium]|nr:peptide chain release factor N(5)-glutamine methyltransferase [Cardiobacteriaceae bacterium]